MFLPKWRFMRWTHLEAVGQVEDASDGGGQADVLRVLGRF
jgi:hypothetical protein